MSHQFIFLKSFAQEIRKNFASHKNLTTKSMQNKKKN